MTPRSLYECSHAVVVGGTIRCRRGHRLSSRSNDDGITVSLLAAGDPLVFAICQECNDFDDLGPPVSEGERGWANRAERIPVDQAEIEAVICAGRIS